MNMRTLENWMVHAEPISCNTRSFKTSTVEYARQFVCFDQKSCETFYSLPLTKNNKFCGLRKDGSVIMTILFFFIFKKKFTISIQ